MLFASDLELPFHQIITTAVLFGTSSYVEWFKNVNIIRLYIDGIFFSTSFRYLDIISPSIFQAIFEPVDWTYPYNPIVALLTTMVIQQMMMSLTTVFVAQELERLK